MTMIYAGIGSRQTPGTVLTAMSELAQGLSDRDWWLRTGGAKGADSAFALPSNGKTIVAIPWNGYNGLAADRHDYWNVVVPPNQQQLQTIAAPLHPAWEHCGQGARKAARP